VLPTSVYNADVDGDLSTFFSATKHESLDDW